MQSDQDFKVKMADYTITAALFTIGSDYLIVLTGGDHPHIGDVTTSSSTQGIQTVKYPSHDGRFHKDDFLSDRIAQKLAGKVPGSLTILAGVHVDGISKSQIAVAAPMADALADQIKQWLIDHSNQSTAPKYYSNDQKPS